MKEKLEMYARIKTAIKELESQMEPLKSEIVQFMTEQDVEELKSDAGKFTISKRRTYTYPKEIQDMEGAVKMAKQEAEARGNATYTELPVLTYKAEKKDEQAV